MKKLIAIKDFIAGGKEYIEGDEIKTNNYEAIVKLNEKGFIEPLTYKDLVLIERALQDNAHIGENLPEILRMVNSLNTFGISSLIQKSCYDLSEDGLHDLPDELRYNLTEADCEQIINIVGDDSLGNRKTR